MATRLDKLYDLLESNNANIRSTAAVQIGQLSSNRQVQLGPLLTKLLPYVRHKNWAVRIAAAEALRHIGRNARTPPQCKLDTYGKQLISLGRLNLLEVLKIGTRLYSTDVRELEGGEVDCTANNEEVKKLMGLMMPGGGAAICDEGDMFGSEDYEVYDGGKVDEGRVSVVEAVRRVVKRGRDVGNEDGNDGPESKVGCLDGPSSYQCGLEGIRGTASKLECVTETAMKAECVAETFMKVECVDSTGDIVEPAEEAGATAECAESCEIKAERVDSSGVEEDPITPTQWDWAFIFDDLLKNLWHPKWEVRHGAVTALREVVRAQGDVMATEQAFVEDLLARVLCTLALDQLSDFVNDEMVAPVRESCGQCLGLVTVYLEEQAVVAVVRHLLVLLSHCEWTVTHGALLGLKYVLASRPAMLGLLLPLVYEPIRMHLRDSRDDDVRCAAAAALMPIFSPPGTAPTCDLEGLRTDLWAVLAARADYTSPGATGAVLHLLGQLYDRDNTATLVLLPVQAEVAACLNMLHWCYYNYGEAVRVAAVKTCSSLVSHYRHCLDEIAPLTMFQVLAQLYQRVLLDDSAQVVREAETLWASLVATLSPERLAMCCLEKLDLWLCCAMQPARLGLCPEALVLPADEAGDHGDGKHQLPLDFFVGGRESFLVEGSSDARDDAVLAARLAACRCLAALCARLSVLPGLDEHLLGAVLTRTHLSERLAMQRFVAASVLSHWSPDPAWASRRPQLLAALRHQLLAALEEPLYYQELLPHFRQMLVACRALAAVLEARQVPLPASVPATPSPALNLPQCQALVAEEVYARLQAAGDAEEASESAFSAARTSVDSCAREHSRLGRLVEVALARALLSWGWLPTRLTPLIRPLMDAVRLETRSLLQHEAARALALLLVDQAAPAIAAPLGKLFRNLVAGLSDGLDAPCEDDSAIVSLRAEEAPTETPEAVKARGARTALEDVCGRLGVTAAPPTAVAVVREVLLLQPMAELARTPPEAPLPALRAMEACLPLLVRHSLPGLDLQAYARCLLDHGLGHRHPSVRHCTARLLALLALPDDASALSRHVLDALVLGEVVSELEHPRDDLRAQGAVETLHVLLQHGPLAHRLALVVLLLPATLRALNAAQEPVRRVAALLFSQLLALLPLEQHGADAAFLSPERQAQRARSRDFIEGLLRPDSIDALDVSEYVRPALRHYQQLGVNWLSFLARYGLHGVLADDMGLGKTLQALCVLAAPRHGDTGPSLVVCPPTLTAHWRQEAARHLCVPGGFSVLLYAGTAEARVALARTFSQHALVVASYDVLRNDAARLARPSPGTAWHYVVLDEGHLIRNHRSKVAVAAKAVQARHRLLLTGTPIQNRVAELWSLFDFLMPGLLGSHAAFHRRYGRLVAPAAAPAIAARRADPDACAAALDALHRQVLPFLLRRLKEDVLAELPPKIVQDYACTMTPLQARLYAGFLAEGGAGGAGADLEMLQDPARRRHAFQALHYLRLVVNHPSLALCHDHPLRPAVLAELAAAGQSLDDAALSGKLLALKQLLVDCGVGADTDADSMDAPLPAHRLLVFCQSRAMLRLVQAMLRTHLPRASHLALDGSVPARDRQPLVDRFNDDPAIDLLLLTTGVGGLGLNLTAADTVVFVEHDWNPMRDLQAMDRAHRLGQRRTVNVYRLVTADSIEERIMGLQQFKLYVARAVVSAENKDAGAGSAAVLDIMATAAAKDSRPLPPAADAGDDYDEEYSLESYLGLL